MNEENQTGDVNVTSVAGSDDAQSNTENNKGKDESAKKKEMLHLKTRPIPAIVTLLGTLVAAVDVFIQQLEFKKSLVIIFTCLVAFLVAGEIIKIVLDHIEFPDPNAVDDDGNMIEKGKTEGEEGEEGPEEDTGEAEGEAPDNEASENAE